MSVTTSIEALAEPIGYDIAQSTDRVQADLLNGLGRGFAQMHTREAETQMAYLAPLLTPEARGMLLALAAVLEHTAPRGLPRSDAWSKKTCPPGFLCRSPAGIVGYTGTGGTPDRRPTRKARAGPPRKGPRWTP